MARCVYVLPLNLIGGLYADLHGDCEMTTLFDMMHTKVVGQPVNGFEAELRFDCDSSLVPDGHISLAVVGPIRSGGVEAERACVMEMLRAIRTQLNLFPVDFNYVALAEKRALFNAMKRVLDFSRADYVEMAILASACETELVDMWRKLSVRVGENHPYVGLEDIEPVSAMHAVLGKQVATLQAEKGYADRLCEMLVLRNRIPDGLAVLDDTVPMPMSICWENCCTTMRTIYKAALKKIQAVPSVIRLHRLRGGEAYKAVVDVSVAPYLFAGDEAATQKAALAKLFYSVIKYVNVERRFAILDFHTEVREYQEVFIKRFDHTIDNVVKCGEKLNQLVRNTSIVVDECAAEMASKLDINEYTEDVLDAVQGLRTILAAKDLRVQDKWKQLQARRISRASLERQLAGDP